MLCSLEDKLRKADEFPDLGIDFDAAVAEVLQSTAGRRMLKGLIQLANPMRSPLVPCPYATHTNIGRREVVAMLLAREGKRERWEGGGGVEPPESWHEKPSIESP